MLVYALKDVLYFTLLGDPLSTEVQRKTGSKGCGIASMWF